MYPVYVAIFGTESHGGGRKCTKIPEKNAKKKRKENPKGFTNLKGAVRDLMIFNSVKSSQFQSENFDQRPQIGGLFDNNLLTGIFLTYDNKFWTF